MLTDVQRPSRHRARVRRNRAAEGFTLIEVLAALLLMAILIPVTMQGVTVASRAGMMGQRKASAMRIAERVLDEQIVSGLVGTATPYGTIIEGNIAYPWTIKSDPWPEVPESGLSVVTVRVEFNVQGNIYDVAATTLYDPAVAAPLASVVAAQ